MNYLYHRVPPNLSGDTLYPLNQLKTVLPQVYEAEVKKYAGREHVLNHKIPIFDCFWNDVIHLMPINPHKLQEAYNHSGGQLRIKKFYQIDPYTLDPDKTIIYMFKYTRKENKFNPDNFIPYNPALIDSLSGLPEATVQYYQEEFNAGRQPLIYFRVPHILYYGTLDTSKLSVIKIQ